MKLSAYSEIISAAEKQNYNRNCVQYLSGIYPSISNETLYSIVSQAYQRYTKKSYPQHHSSAAVEAYYNAYSEAAGTEPPGFLITQADKLNVSPVVLARIILEKHCTDADGKPPSRSMLSQMMKDTATIDDPILADEVQLCVLEDAHYGPVVDSIRRSIGYEYEYKLQEILTKQKIAFLGEEDMRERGFDKTPDFKLEVPISVDGYVVNWIESKALFGDPASHKGYLKDQFWSYWNRFGPGLVIYWFGFIDELDTNRDKGILLFDKFPENFVYFDASSLT